MFTIETPHNLLIGVEKLLKIYILWYDVFENLCTELSGNVRGDKMVCEILREYDTSVKRATGVDCGKVPIIWLRVNFMNGEVPSELNNPLNSDGMQGMMKIKLSECFYSSSIYFCVCGQRF